jgi:YggT family protein
MLLDLLLMVLQTVLGFFSTMLLARFFMQWTRAPFRNPLGQFVVAITDPALRPLRRWVPNPFNFDAGSLLLAWLTQAVFIAVAYGFSGALHTLSAQSAAAIALLALVETTRLALYVLVGAVLISAALSWINPGAPLAPVFDAVTRPFLAPFRRRIPLVGGVDLSPLVLLLLLQVALAILNSARFAAVPLLSA